MAFFIAAFLCVVLLCLNTYARSAYCFKAEYQYTDYKKLAAISSSVFSNS